MTQEILDIHSYLVLVDVPDTSVGSGDVAAVRKFQYDRPDPGRHLEDQRAVAGQRVC